LRLNLLEPWLAESHTAVIIPLDDRVIFVSLLKLCPTLQSVFRSCPNPRRDLRDLVPGWWHRARQAVVSWHGRSQGSPQGVTGAAGELLRNLGIGLLVVWAIFPIVNRYSIGLERMVGLVQTAQFWQLIWLNAAAQVDFLRIIARIRSQSCVARRTDRAMESDPM
jgi:hypothetical protein